MKSDDGDDCGFVKTGTQLSYFFASSPLYFFFFFGWVMDVGDLAGGFNWLGDGFWGFTRGFDGSG